MSAATACLLDCCRSYRDAYSRYARAFATGNVNAIEDTFSRMQEIGRAFRDGVRWAEARNSKREERP